MAKWLVGWAASFAEDGHQGKEKRWQVKKTGKGEKMPGKKNTTMNIF